MTKNSQVILNNTFLHVVGDNKPSPEKRISRKDNSTREIANTLASHNLYRGRSTSDITHALVTNDGDFLYNSQKVCGMKTPETEDESDDDFALEIQGVFNELYQSEKRPTEKPHQTLPDYASLVDLFGPPTPPLEENLKPRRPSTFEELFSVVGSEHDSTDQPIVPPPPPPQVTTLPTPVYDSVNPGFHNKQYQTPGQFPTTGQYPQNNGQYPPTTGQYPPSGQYPTNNGQSTTYTWAVDPYLYNMKFTTGQSEANPSFDKMNQNTPSTTVMLRNIPNKYTQRMLVDVICDQHKYRNLIDFFYLPIDFRNKCNVGYAFINFKTHESAKLFMDGFNGYRLVAFNSNKVCQVNWARVQGLRDNIEHYRNSPVNGVPVREYKPILFDECGNELEFPCPDFPLAPVRLRAPKC